MKKKPQSDKSRQDYINKVLDIAFDRNLKVTVLNLGIYHLRVDNNLRSIDIWRKRFGVLDISFFAPYSDLEELLDNYFGDDFDPRRYSKEHQELDGEFKQITKG